ncbi:MAG: hypothetical protein ACTSWX_09245 [Promethearchaeota archaeon]
MEYIIDPDLVELTKKEFKERKDQSKSKKTSMDDIILFAFANIDDNVNVFDGSKEKLNNLFFDLKMKYPEYFGDLQFMNCEDYPFSKDLERIFSRFQQSQAISIKNPLYKRFEMNNKTKKEIKKYLTETKKIKIDDEKISVIAKLIQDKLGNFTKN